MNYTKATQKKIADYLNAVRKSMQGSPEEEIDEVVLHLKEQIDVALQESGEAADEADTISGILSAMSPPESFAVAKNEQPRESRKGYVALTLALISLVFLVFGFPALFSFPVFVSAIVLAVMSRKTVPGKVAIGLLILAPILFIVVHYIGVAPANRQAKTEAAEAEVAKQDTVDSLTDELIVQLNHFGEAIVSAKDKASAEEAVKKLNGIGDEIAAIAARLNKLEPPSEEEKERIEEKMLNADKARNHMEGAMQAVMFDEKVSGIIAPAVQEFAARMEEHKAIFDRHTVSAKRLEQRDKASQQFAVNNLKQMYLLLFEYDQDEGAYPDRLELLQEKGYTVALASIDSYRVDGKKVKFVYRQGFSSKSPAETVLMYTPDLIGSQGVCLLNDGSVKTMPAEEFKPLIDSLK